MDPINIALMNVPEFIKSHNAKPVTSIFIKEQSSNNFHPNGLFSEFIFGQINSTDRLVRFGFINLKTEILHPIIYNNFIKLKALYGEIMSRKTYAIFDVELHDFVRTSEEDPNANTGYKFFIDHIDQIKLIANNSLTQNEKVSVFEKYKSFAKLTHCLVSPAGVRDMDISEGKPSSDSINKIYASLLNYTNALPFNGSLSDIYDNIRLAIQKKVCEIYAYLFDMCEGKYGLFQRKYGSRSLALGTRNVMSSPVLNAKTPSDPSFYKLDEVKVPLFQCAKMLAPLVIYNVKLLFFSDIFNITADRVAVIDPKTFGLVYQPITEDEKNKFLSSEGINKIVSLFRDKSFRFAPIQVLNEQDQPFYLFMVYDHGNVIYLTRNVQELKTKFIENNIEFDRDKLRPLTYAELLYMSVYRAALKKHALLTRYPAIGISSDVPCKIHLVSTDPGRAIEMVNINYFDTAIRFPEYPIINGAFVDSTMVHPMLLAGLGGDHDGDTISLSALVTTEANEEIEKYINTPARYVHTNGTLMLGITDLIKLTLFNLSRPA